MVNAERKHRKPKPLVARASDLQPDGATPRFCTPVWLSAPGACPLLASLVYHPYGDGPEEPDEPYIAQIIQTAPTALKQRKSAGNAHEM